MELGEFWRLSSTFNLFFLFQFSFLKILYIFLLIWLSGYIMVLTKKAW